MDEGLEEVLSTPMETIVQDKDAKALYDIFWVAMDAQNVVGETWEGLDEEEMRAWVYMSRCAKGLD